MNSSRLYIVTVRDGKHQTSPFPEYDFFWILSQRADNQEEAVTLALQNASIVRTGTMEVSVV